MDLHEIPISRWRPFLDQFSRLHHGQEVQVETTAPGGGPTSQVDHLPLLGVTQEQQVGEQRISISAGDPRGNLFGHAVVNPTRLCAAEWNDGTSGELRIDLADGGAVRVRVGPAEEMLPPGFITDGLYERD